ncbi:hypothetical protein Tco_0370002 [Tanacetum coccineum]
MSCCERVDIRFHLDPCIYKQFHIIPNLPYAVLASDWCPGITVELAGGDQLTIGEVYVHFRIDLSISSMQLGLPRKYRVYECFHDSKSFSTNIGGRSIVPQHLFLHWLPLNISAYE